MDVAVQATLPVTYQEALERLVYFNSQQAYAQGAIVQAIDQYGGLEIASDADGLRVRVNRYNDAQCLFALVSRKGRVELGAGLVYLRTSREELVVLHIAVADRYGRSRRIALHLIMKLVRAVRATAHRLRGVTRVTMHYRQSRQLRIRDNGNAATIEGTSGHSRLPPAARASNLRGPRSIQARPEPAMNRAGWSQADPVPGPEPIAESLEPLWQTVAP